MLFRNQNTSENLNQSNKTPAMSLNSDDVHDNVFTVANSAVTAAARNAVPAPLAVLHIIKLAFMCRLP